MEQNENVSVDAQCSKDDLDSFLNQCTESWFCPLCADKGVQSRVILYQANARQALYFCETPDCMYPHTDESEPVIVNRPLVEMPVRSALLEKFEFPLSILNEGNLTYRELFELSLIKDAYSHLDEWIHLEKELAKYKAFVDSESEYNPLLKNQKINTKCTPINYLRNIPADLMKYVKHFIPNIDEVVDLLDLDVL